MIFGHVPMLREHNEHEQIDKSLVETWKSYQKKLSEAADFVAQHTLITEQRLRNHFQVRTRPRRPVTRAVTDEAALSLFEERLERSRAAVHSIDQRRGTRSRTRTDANVSAVERGPSP